MQTNSLPGGLWPVMLTPFLQNNEVDYDVLKRLTEFYIKSGANGLFANCLSSEMFQLTEAERLKVIATVVSMAALTEDMKPTEEMSAEFTRRKKRVLELVGEIPGIKCSDPEGAFYIFPDMSSYFGKSDGQHTINNSADLCMYILNNAHVSSVMGAAFGEPNCVRFSFANSLPNIERGWARIKDALSKLN